MLRLVSSQLVTREPESLLRLSTTQDESRVFADQHSASLFVYFIRSTEVQFMGKLSCTQLASIGVAVTSVTSNVEVCGAQSALPAADGALINVSYPRLGLEARTSRACQTFVFEKFLPRVFATQNSRWVN